MALSAEELDRIHLRKLATPGKKYYGDNDKVYIGTEDRRLKIFELASQTTYSNIVSNLEAKTVQTAIEKISNLQRLTLNKEVEIDFGSDRYQKTKVFSITDPDITENDFIILSKSNKQPSDGRDSDEVYVENIQLSAKTRDGGFDLYVNSLKGTISGKFIINYKI